MTHKEFLTQLGIEIQVARLRRKMTRQQLVKLTGLSEACIMNIENGKSNGLISNYKRICDALGIKISELFIFVE